MGADRARAVLKSKELGQKKLKVKKLNSVAKAVKKVSKKATKKAKKATKKQAKKQKKQKKKVAKAGMTLAKAVKLALVARKKVKKLVDMVGREKEPKVVK